MKTKAIKVADISIDGETQQREKISMDDVAAYAEAMRCGAQFPSVVLFFDGVTYWLADGFHRYHAHKAAEISDMLAEVYEGTKRDARLYSAGANAKHGIRLSNADKRRSVLVLLLDKEWMAWSDSAIARHCHVTQPFVGKIRKDIAPPTPKTETSILDTSITVIGNDLEPAPVLEVENQNTGAEAEPEEPEYTELDAAKDQIAELQDMVAIAKTGPADATVATALISELRAEIKTLTATLSAVKSSRDGYQSENAQLKKQVQMQRKEIDKLTGKKTA